MRFMRRGRKGALACREAEPCGRPIAIVRGTVLTLGSHSIVSYAGRFGGWIRQAKPKRRAVGGETNVIHERPCRCPECGAALLIDSPVNILARWPEILARYGFKAVAMGGGWEKFGLACTVPLDSPGADSL
jgi:hypothetical protein